MFNINNINVKRFNLKDGCDHREVREGGQRGGPGFPAVSAVQQQSADLPILMTMTNHKCLSIDKGRIQSRRKKNVCETV